LLIDFQHYVKCSIQTISSWIIVKVKVNVKVDKSYQQEVMNSEF